MVICYRLMVLIIWCFQQETTSLLRRWVIYAKLWTSFMVSVFKNLQCMLSQLWSNDKIVPAISNKALNLPGGMRYIHFQIATSVIWCTLNFVINRLLRWKSHQLWIKLIKKFNLYSLFFNCKFFIQKLDQMVLILHLINFYQDIGWSTNAPS